MRPTGTGEEQHDDEGPADYLGLVFEQERALQAAVMPRAATFGGHFDVFELVREVLNPTEGNDR